MRQTSRGNMKVNFVIFFLFSLLLGFSQANPRLNLPENRLARRAGFFGDMDDPFLTMRRSFQGLSDNVGRSMQNLMSALSVGMKSLISRTPKHIPYTPAPVPPSYPHKELYGANDPSSYTSAEVASYAVPDIHVYSPPSQAVHHHVEPVYTPGKPVYTPVEPVYSVVEPVYNNNINPDCDCTDDAPFLPVENTLDTVHEDDQSTGGEVYGAPHTPVITEYKPLSTAVQYSTPPPVQYSTPAPAPVQYSTPAPAPVQYSTPPPVQYSTPGPLQYSTPAPVQYSTPAPVQYSTPLPVQYSTPAPVQFSTEDFEEVHKYTDEELCAHLRKHKEDLHAIAVVHPGGSNDVDIHKLETVGVHSEHQKSSAVVPDQSHPEKYFSVDCANVKKVVSQRLYYIDLKSLTANLKGHKVVRDQAHPSL